MKTEDLDHLNRRLRNREFPWFASLAVLLIVVLLVGPETSLAARLIATAWGIFALVTAANRLLSRRPMIPVVNETEEDRDPELERLKNLGYLVAGMVVLVAAWTMEI